AISRRVSSEAFDPGAAAVRIVAFLAQRCSSKEYRHFAVYQASLCNVAILLRMLIAQGQEICMLNPGTCLYVPLTTSPRLPMHAFGWSPCRMPRTSSNSLELLLESAENVVDFCRNLLEGWFMVQ